MRIILKFQEGTGKKGVRHVVHTQGALGGYTLPAFKYMPFYNEQDSIDFMNNLYDLKEKDFMQKSASLPFSKLEDGGFYQEVYDPENKVVHIRRIFNGYSAPNDTTYIDYNLNNHLVNTSSVVHSNDVQVPYVIMKNGKPFYLLSGSHYLNGKSVLYDIK